MKTLIAYATKHGATRQYAEQLAGQLPGETTLVDLKKDPGVDVSVFDTVIVGGAVYFGKVQKEVRDFCVRNLALLRNKRLGLFICCLFDGQQAERQLQTAFPGELLEAALVKDAFGGRVNPAELTLPSGSSPGWSLGARGCRRNAPATPRMPSADLPGF